jgi:Ca-activated chloride channel family protein
MENIMKIASSILFIAFIMAGFIAWQKSDQSFANLWQSPDRQGQLMMDQNKYHDAAETFIDPMQRGVALYKAGEFNEALAVFNTIVTPDVMYNRANAQMMLGKYDAAIDLYDKVLVQRASWDAALTNREIAIARKAALAPPDDDAGGTGGKMGADEIVFDDRAKNSSAEETVEGGDAEPMSDEEMRALWLRKVQTKPSDFLRAKFSYQFQRDKSAQSTPPSKP